MIDPRQLRDLIIVPVLQILKLPSDTPDPTAAAQLLMGTAMQESELTWIHQITGPALGLWQMEPATANDLLKWLRSRTDVGPWGQLYVLPNIGTMQMIGNLYYACAMARIHYYRVPAPLPAANDIDAQAAYYKQYYNTPAGAATVTQYKQRWAQLMQEMKGWA